VICAKRILANDHGSALFNRVLAATFSDAGNSLVRLHGHNVETLIKEHRRIGIQVKAHAGNL
jgi:hypothetical protein